MAHKKRRLVLLLSALGLLWLRDRKMTENEQRLGQSGLR